MDIVLQAAKDLLKFKIINSINTGDKTFDNLLTGFVMSITLILFSEVYWKMWWNWLKFTIIGCYDIKQKDVAEYYSEKLKACPNQGLKSNIISGTTEKIERLFFQRLLTHISIECCHFVKLEKILIDLRILPKRSSYFV